MSHLLKLRPMQRSRLLLEKRKQFVHNYVKNNPDKQMKLIVAELTERLFISEKTIFNILKYYESNN